MGAVETTSRKSVTNADYADSTALMPQAVREVTGMQEREKLQRVLQRSAMVRRSRVSANGVEGGRGC